MTEDMRGHIIGSGIGGGPTVKWSSPETREYYETLLAEIAKSMTPPRWAQRDLRAYQEWYREADLATRVMREEALRTFNRFTTPVYIVPAGVAESPAGVP